MDYSYFTSAPQPYQFFALPPTTAPTTASQVDDFRVNTLSNQYDAAFAAFQQNLNYDPTSFLAQSHHLPPQSPSKPLRADSVISIPEINVDNLQPASNDITPDEQARGRSSSEEKESLTPAQSRRKAQNRAAQRAFRERKERHVKDLEAKLTSLQHQSASVHSENERLKRELAKIATENEILRATSNTVTHPFMEDSNEISATGPLGYIPKDFKGSLNGASCDDSEAEGAQYSTSRRTFIDDATGESLLAAGATWDYIQAHELFKKGLVDVGDVCERLKKMARCDDQGGPVFTEGDVRKAIAESAVAGGRDELI